MARHFDVVVVGRSVGTLATAALLARRDFRVLVVGQAPKPDLYRYEEHVLCRRTFSTLFASSPAYRRILHELAQSQRFRQRSRELDPMFSFWAMERRVQVPPDMRLFAREIEREFPEVRQLVEELYATFSDVNATADTVFERELVWPPGSWWERFETGRAASQLPFTSEDGRSELLGKFPPGHPFRSLVALPALFASNRAGPAEDLPRFALCRLHGSWTRGVQEIEGGEEGFTEFMTERIVAHGGQCAFESRARAIVVKRGRVAGVWLEGEEEPTGADALVSCLTGENLADMAGGEGITSQARQEWPRVAARVGRFVVSLVVREELLPQPLGRHCFVLPNSGGTDAPRALPLHVEVLRSEPRTPGVAKGTALLVVEALLPRQGPLLLLEARKVVLDTLRAHLPFLDKHLLVVDCPHDGLPLERFDAGQMRELDRMHVSTVGTEAEPMVAQWQVEPKGYLGLSGEPVRGPIPGTILVGPTVLPALGQEGELLAALGASRIITSRDRSRQRLRRQMWSKIET
jgi:hypothetical protein